MNGQDIIIKYKLSMSRKNDILEHFGFLASKKYQTRVWLNGEGSEVDDYNEALLTYYSDIPKSNIEGIDLKKHNDLKKNFNDEELGVIYHFHEILNKFIDDFGWDLTHEELLKHKEWINVQNRAKKVCEYFDVKVAE